MAVWKRITIPKMVYLPTGDPNGAFKDTGCRVEPQDQVEILPGSRLIRINGVEHTLLIPADNLPLDGNNCLRLDRPAPPVVSLASGGKGRASVGRQGEAVIAARNNWDQETATNWGGDAASDIGKDWIQAQLRHADKNGAFEDVEDDALFEDNEVTAPQLPRTASGFNPTVLNEERVTRTVTLKNGQTAEVLVDPHSGRDAGYVSRVYDGIGVNPKEAARILAAQAAEATDVTPGRRRQEPPPRVASAPAPQPAPQAPPTISTGIRDLDGLLEATTGGLCGVPLGHIAYVAGPQDLRLFLMNSMSPSPTVSNTIEGAFARIHLLKPNDTPVVFIHLEDEAPSDALRLTIAEQLPVLAEVIKNHGRCSALILTPDWMDKTPTLLNFIPTIRLSINRHDRDDRFLVASLLKGAKQGQPSVTFPR